MTDQQSSRWDGRVITRVPCERCKGTGRLKGVRAKAGSRAAVGRQWKASCGECVGSGWHDIVTKPADKGAPPK